MCVFCVTFLCVLIDLCQGYLHDQVEGPLNVRLRGLSDPKGATVKAKPSLAMMRWRKENFSVYSHCSSRNIWIKRNVFTVKSTIRLVILMIGYSPNSFRYIMKTNKFFKTPQPSSRARNFTFAKFLNLKFWESKPCIKLIKKSEQSRWTNFKWAQNIEIKESSMANYIKACPSV